MCFHYVLHEIWMFWYTTEETINIHPQFLFQNLGDRYVRIQNILDFKVKQKHIDCILPNIPTGVL